MARTPLLRVPASVLEVARLRNEHGVSSAQAREPGLTLDDLAALAMNDRPIARKADEMLDSLERASLQHPGFLNGAVESGQRCAREVLADLRG